MNLAQLNRHDLSYEVEGSNPSHTVNEIKYDSNF